MGQQQKASQRTVLEPVDEVLDGEMVVTFGDTDTNEIVPFSHQDETYTAALDIYL